jgi:hypothetical protein
MATATVVGTLIGLVLADDALVALIGSRIYRDVMVEENRCPLSRCRTKRRRPYGLRNATGSRSTT